MPPSPSTHENLWTAVSYFDLPLTLIFSPLWRYDPLSGHDFPLWGFAITLIGHTTLDRLFWTSNQPKAQIFTWQHATLTTDIHPCPRWNSNPQSQQVSGRAATGIGFTLDIPPQIAVNRQWNYITFCMCYNMINQLPRLMCYINSRQQEPTLFSPNIGLRVYHTVTLGFHQA